MTFARLGWDAEREQQLAALADPELIPGRVRAQHRGRFDITTAAGDRTATTLAAVHPAVGDWVALEAANTSLARVRAILPRRTTLERADPGGTGTSQVLCANADTVLCCSSLNRDFNIARLERQIAIASAGGAEAVVALTKSDLVEDPGVQALDTRTALGFSVPVIALSATTGDGLDALGPWLAPGRTLALAGSSGVGKSTLVNALLGEERQHTLEIRSGDDRGRHATVHRELLLVPGGGALIDLPGIRLPKMWDPEGVERAFADIEELEQRCRFNDCSHTGEPGCAIAAAIESGELDPKRLARRDKLAGESRHMTERAHQKRARERESYRRNRHITYRQRPD